MDDKFDQIAEPLLVSAKEAARMLAISTRKLWSMSVGGEIPSIKIGKARRYNVQSLKDWIARREEKCNA